MRHITLWVALLLVASCDASPGVGGVEDGGVPPGSETTASDDGTDSDSDFITDVQEGSGTIDTDGDGISDDLDPDSDDDGIPDADEAGDTDLTTRPVDTDADGTPDFRDRDSDADGLPDASEIGRGTDPRNPDSDGDGVNDLVEVVAETDPSDAGSNPRAEGDFFFVVPYQMPPDPPRDSLVFQIQIRRADVYFMIDSSISMRQEITDLRDSLEATVVPGVRGAIADVQLGVGHFDQCPENLGTRPPGGNFGIVNLQGSTSAVASVLGALDTVVSRIGGGPREPYAQAAWLFATGDHTRFGDDEMGAPLVAPRDCPADTVGYGCVRPDALPILVMIGDENYAQGDACDVSLTTADVAAALNSISGKLVALGGRGLDPWMEIATMTGSVDGAGAPYVFPLGGGTIDSDVVDAISALASSLPLDLTAVARDADDDGVDATIFIERLEANATGGITDPRDPSRVCVGGLTTEDRDGDTFPDTFIDVAPSTPVCFDVIVRQNDTVMPTDAPQVFRAHIDVVGDDVTVLDTRDVFFLVPPDEDTPFLF